jgi:hypothetical protein
MQRQNALIEPLGTVKLPAAMLLDCFCTQAFDLAGIAHRPLPIKKDRFSP